MRKKIGFLTIILSGLMLLSSCSDLRIKTEIDRLGINFGDKDSILRLEKDPNLFKSWTKWRPVGLLMTGEEKKIAKKILKIEDEVARNDSSRKFINWFWQRRDDNTYDDINEFKENFYGRVIEAQTRFADKENADKMRRCAHGRGWQTDWGMIYIALGEPFSGVKYDVRNLVSLIGGNYRDSVLMPQEMEVWYYETPEDFTGFLFSDNVAWIIFEQDISGYWRFGETTFSLFFSYENYYNHYSVFVTPSMTYGSYLNDVYGLIGAIAETYIYDWDLEFEDFK